MCQACQYITRRSISRVASNEEKSTPRQRKASPTDRQRFENCLFMVFSGSSVPERRSVCGELTLAALRCQRRVFAACAVLDMTTGGCYFRFARSNYGSDCFFGTLR